MSLAARVRNAKIKVPSKVLVIDIERLPGMARVWEPRTRYIPPRAFTEWPRLLCFAAQWYHEKDMVFAAEWQGREEMIRKAWELYDEAEAVVTYNGVRFDNPHLKTEWLQLGLKPPRPWKDVDLYRVVRREFGYESKSLDTVTRRLGRRGKSTHYDMDVAQAAADGDERAQRKLERYNKGDVALTLWLADRLRGWMPNHPVLGPLGHDVLCNQCGSDRLVKQPTLYRAVVIDYVLFRCEDCGGLIRGGSHSRAASSRGVR